MCYLKIYKHMIRVNEVFVECMSSMITRNGPLPLNVAPFPTDTLRLIQLMKEFETLTVEAAVTGNLVAAKRALILNPIVNTGTVLDEALKETVKENLDYMPQFSWMFETL